MSTKSDDKALFDYLVAEYNHPFVWSDWSYLEGRRINDPSETLCDYRDTAVEAIADAVSRRALMESPHAHDLLSCGTVPGLYQKLYQLLLYV